MLGGFGTLWVGGPRRGFRKYRIRVPNAGDFLSFRSAASVAADLLEHLMASAEAEANKDRDHSEGSANLRCPTHTHTHTHTRRLIRTGSEYCSACVSRVDLLTK